MNIKKITNSYELAYGTNVNNEGAVLFIKNTLGPNRNLLDKLESAQIQISSTYTIIFSGGKACLTTRISGQIRTSTPKCNDETRSGRKIIKEINVK